MCRDQLKLVFSEMKKYTWKLVLADETSLKENFKALKTFDLPEKAKNIICTSSAFSWKAYKTS